MAAMTRMNATDPLAAASLRTCIALALAAASASLAGCGAEAAVKAAPPPPREVEVWTVRPMEVRRTGEYLGSLLSRESVTVMPQVNGYVSKIHVRPGEHVKAGAPLIDIDARQESAALDSAVAQQSSAATGLELARTTLARTEALYREGLVSAQELERARSDVAAKQAAARAAQAAVSQRKVQLQFHTIRAAVPGVVGEVQVRVGANVNANTELTTIAQADVLELSIGLPAARARQLPPGAPVELLDAAGNVVLATTTFYVAPEANPKSQLVEVKAVFQNTLGLLPSEVVRTRVVFGTDETLVVPAEAVVRMSGQPFVFAVFDQGGQATVERRPVTLGDLGERNYVLEAGLKAGDRIAVSSLQSLRDGAPVKPVEKVEKVEKPAVEKPAETPSEQRPSTK